MADVAADGCRLLGVADCEWRSQRWRMQPGNFVPHLDGVDAPQGTDAELFLAACTNSLETLRSYSVSFFCLRALFRAERVANILASQFKFNSCAHSVGFLCIFGQSKSSQHLNSGRRFLPK